MNDVNTSLDELLRQLHTAKSLDFLMGVDILVEEFKNNGTIQSLIGFTDRRNPSSVPKKIYVRFSNTVSHEKIRAIKTYVESTYGYSCHFSEWTAPTRLDITLS